MDTFDFIPDRDALAAAVGDADTPEEAWAIAHAYCDSSAHPEWADMLIEERLLRGLLLHLHLPAVGRVQP